MKKLLFSIATISLAIMNQNANAQGQSCENAIEVDISSYEEHVIPDGQEDFYFQFTPDVNEIMLGLQNTVYDEFPNIKSIKVYEMEDCENLTFIQEDTVKPNAELHNVHLFNIKPSTDYLVVINRDVSFGLDEVYFGVEFQSYTVLDCPTYTDECGELIKNGSFNHVTMSPVPTGDSFVRNYVCEWEDAFGTPDLDTSSGDTYANLFYKNKIDCAINYNDVEGLRQDVAFSANKEYYLKFKMVRMGTSPKAFKVALVNSTDLDMMPSYGGTFHLPGYKFYCDYLQITNKQDVVNLSGSNISSTLTSYDFCFTPTSNYDAIVFFPEPDNLNQTTRHYISIGDISLKELELDLGADVTMDDCGLPITIGPDCVYEGATYSWSPSTGLSDPNVPNPIASPTTQTSYSLTITIPGTSCQLTDNITVTPSSTSGVMSFDYTIPPNQEVSWVVNNMTSSSLGVNVFENYDIFIAGDFTVDSDINGAPLTFKNCNIYVNRDSKVVVDTTERMVLDNTTITNCDGYFWQGIELSGMNNLSQTGGLQPSLKLENGAKISNARVGIRTGLTDGSGNFVNNTGGGYVIITDAQFVNNYRDIKFHPYINSSGGTVYKDKTEIYNTEFISSQSLPAGMVTQSHIEMEGVDGIHFGACTFDNQLLQSNLNERGMAIEAVDASFSVTDHTSYGSSVFKGFHTAIYSYTQNPLFTPYVRKSHFENNVKGLSVNGNDAAFIVENTFEIPDVSSTYEPYGIYMNYTNGYQIEENDFTYNGGGIAANAVGIVIYNSNQTTNKIYNNSFSDLQVGTLVHGDNKLSNNEGLVIKCNDYDNDGFHIALNQLQSMFGNIEPEIALDQGGNASQTDPAGNTFNDLCSGSAQSDIFVTVGGSAFNYYHHTNSVTEPSCRTTTKVTNIPTFFNYSSKDEACPSNLDGGGGGGTEPEPGFVDHSNKGEIEAKVRLLSNSNKSGDTLSDSLLNAYLRIQLMQDTINMDSIMHYLSYSSNAYNQLRGVAAMARKGDTTFGDKSLHRKMPQLAMDYATFQKEAKVGNGRLFAKAKNDPTHPFYVWAKAAAKKKGGENIPAPLNLPQKREKTDDLAGNANDKVNVYPIPADQNVFVEVENAKNVEIKLFDVQGRLVKTVRLNLEEENKLPVEALNNGVYFIQLIKEDGSIETQKLSIQH